MPFLPLFLKILGTAALVGGTVASVKAQRESADLQRQQQKVSTRRSRRQSIREAQLRQAQARTLAGAAGALQGSALPGGQSALTSQLGTQLGYSSELSGLSQQINLAESRAATAGDLASIGLTGLNIGMSL